jgi:hypothetical protein
MTVLRRAIDQQLACSNLPQGAALAENGVEIAAQMGSNCLTPESLVTFVLLAFRDVRRTDDEAQRMMDNVIGKADGW